MGVSTSFLRSRLLIHRLEKQLVGCLQDLNSIGTKKFKIILKIKLPPFIPFTRSRINIGQADFPITFVPNAKYTD